MRRNIRVRWASLLFATVVIVSGLTGTALASTEDLAENVDASESQHLLQNPTCPQIMYHCVHPPSDPIEIECTETFQRIDSPFVVDLGESDTECEIVGE